MAFKTFYDDINQYAQPWRETPESMRPGYTSPAIRAMGAQRWKSIGKPMGSQYISPLPADQLGLPNMPRPLRQYGGINVNPSIDRRIDPTRPLGPITPSVPTYNKGTMRIPTPSARQTQYQPPKLTPFMRTFLSNVQTMDEEQRGEYFDTLSASIKDRMDRWSYRIARGIPLTADQQTQYNSLRGAFNDIQSYLSNQSGYDEYLRRMGGVSPVAQAGQRY